MPKFKVIYRCPTCGHEDTEVAEHPNWNTAMRSIHDACPNHRELGDVHATFAVEVAPNKK